jgi:hypothetical protein
MVRHPGSNSKTVAQQLSNINRKYLVQLVSIALSAQIDLRRSLEALSDGELENEWVRQDAISSVSREGMQS